MCVSSLSLPALSAGVKSVEMWRRWECGLCDAREKVEQESKLGDFEIQSIKLLAFRRAVAGVVRPLLHPLAPTAPSPPPPSAAATPSPRSSSHPLFLLCMSVPLLSSRSLLRPFSRVLFPSFSTVALPLKCIPMYHHPRVFHPPLTIEISTCVHTHTNRRYRASLFLFQRPPPTFLPLLPLRGSLHAPTAVGNAHTKNRSSDSTTFY